MTLFELMARISLDTSEYDSSLDRASGKAKTFGEKMRSGFGTIAKVGGAALAGAATAVGVLAEKSVDGYAEYQQMVGGVKKLYGNMGLSLEEYATKVGKSTSEVKSEWKTLQASQNLVLKNAREAYANTGMSANQYMSMATSFSASLINSLGGDTKKAAEQTDVAMRAISDNFNTFGGDINMVQGAFQGFAKQNYTMLDNLKLGYGGTKTEMERLIADANTWAQENGKAADLSIDSFSDVVTAIDYIQQKQNIAGTTANESVTTIEGSLLTLKAAWSNLVTGFASPDADIGQLVKNVMDSAGVAVGNLLPAFQQAFTGIVEAIDTALPVIIEKIPEFIDSMVIPMVGAGAQLIMSLGQSIMENAPLLLQYGLNIINKFGEGFSTGFPQLISRVVPMLLQLVSGIMSNAGQFLSTGVNLILNLAQGILNGIPVLISYIPQIVSTIWNGLTSVDWIGLGTTLLNGIIDGIKNAVPKIVSAIKAVGKSASTAFGNINWGEAGRRAISLLGSALRGAGKLIVTVLKSVGKIGITAFKAVNWKGVGKSVISFIGGAIRGAGSLVLNALKSAGTKALNAFKSLSWVQLGSNIISGIVRGIGGAAGSLFNKLRSLASDALSAAKRALKIGSPSKLFRDEVGKQIPAGMAIGIDRGRKYVSKAMDNLNTLTMSSIPDYDMGYSSDVPSVASPSDEPYATIEVPDGTEGNRGVKNVTVYNYITVDGARDPEEYTERLVRSVRQQVRMA